MPSPKKTKGKPEAAAKHESVSLSPLPDVDVATLRAGAASAATAIKGNTVQLRM